MTNAAERHLADKEVPTRVSVFVGVRIYVFMHIFISYTSETSASTTNDDSARGEPFVWSSFQK